MPKNKAEGCTFAEYMGVSAGLEDLVEEAPRLEDDEPSFEKGFVSEPSQEEVEMELDECLGHILETVGCVADQIALVHAKLEAMDRVLKGMVSSKGCTCDVEMTAPRPKPPTKKAPSNKKKGTPGRPAKEAPKTALPPRKEKSNKTAAKKIPVSKKTEKKKASAKKKR
jgi:hypothetical protein